MQTQISIQKDFIDRFTAEILAVIKKKNDAEEAAEREEERIRKAVEVEKLKKKFAEYLKTAKEEEIKKARQPVVKPESPKIGEKKAEISKAEEKHEEMVPSVAKIAPPEKPVQTAKKPLPRRELPIQKIELPKEFPRTPQGEIDFGKVVFFVRDPLVTYIECPGENKNIIIRKAGRVMRTQITMNKDEIKNTIISFSQRVRIPLVEGVLKARYQNLEISAVVSDVISPSFILKKDIIPPLEKPETALTAPIMPVTPRTLAPRQVFPPVRRPFLPAQSAPALPAAQQPPAPVSAQAPITEEAPKEMPQISPTPEVPAAPPVQPQITAEKKSMGEEFTPSIMSKPAENTKQTQPKQYKPLPK